MMNTKTTAQRSLESEFIAHRLSWFATFQGLLFLSFVLVDKRANVLLTSLLVCAGVAMCIPAMSSAYTNLGIRNRFRVLLAVCWVTIGTAQFILHSL